MQQLTLTRPDDWHLHLRDGDVLAAVLMDTARRFAGETAARRLADTTFTVFPA